MANIQTVLNQRLQKKDQTTSKMAEMARKSTSGNMTSFSGIFSVVELNAQEKKSLKEILEKHLISEGSLSEDLQALEQITSEVKAINNQAIILHGERIKKAQAILIKYQEGAFTQWLLAAYGNRQTPYNFLQYYQFWEKMPKTLRPQIEIMPRQAIYTLASRDGDLERKESLIRNYQGETKEEILAIIRETFPLEEKDKRKGNLGVSAINQLKKLSRLLSCNRSLFTPAQKMEFKILLDRLREMV